MMNLASIYTTHQCPACKKAIDLDAKEALSQSKNASVLAAVLTALFICADGTLLRLVGITEEVFKTWFPAVQLLLILSVILVGLVSVVAFQLLFIKILLSFTRHR
jgi:hypothetical protein